MTRQTAVREADPSADSHRLLPPALALVLVLAPAAALAATAPPAAPPREEVRLNLAEVRARALEKNVDLRVERESEATAAAGEERARGAYDPTLKIDGRYRDRTDPVNSIFSGAPAGEIAPNSSGLAGNLGLFQLLPTGGTLALTSSVSRDETNNIYSILSPSWSTSVGLELRQPLLRDRAIDPARRGLKVAQLDRQRSSASVRRVTSETIAAAERAFWTLVAARQEVETRQTAVALAERQRVDVTARVEAGTLSEADLAPPRAEVERRRGDLFAAREAEARAENALKSLLLSDPDDALWRARILPAETPEDGDASGAGAAVSLPVDVDADASFAEAVRRRPEVAEAALRLDRLAVDEESARDRTKPQLDLVAGYARRGIAGSQNPTLAPPFPTPVQVPDAVLGELGRSYGTIAEGRFPDASIGLALSIPIGNRAAQADAAQARSSRAQAELALVRTRQQVEVEVRNAAVALVTAAQRVEAAKAGRDAAEVQLAAEEERFASGLTTSFFVLTRQADLTLARLAETSARSDLRKARVEWSRATGTLLAERSITVEDTVPAGPSAPAAPEGGSR